MDIGRAWCVEELRNWIPVRYRVYKARARERSVGNRLCRRHQRHIAHAPRRHEPFMEAVFHQETKNSWQRLRGTKRAHQTERPRPQKGQDLHRHHWKPNCNVGQTTTTTTTTCVVVKLPSQGQKGALPGCQSGSPSGAGGRQTCHMRQLWLSVTLHFRIVLDVLCCLRGVGKRQQRTSRGTHNKHTHTVIHIHTPPGTQQSATSHMDAATAPCVEQWRQDDAAPTPSWILVPFPDTLRYCLPSSLLVE